MTIDEDVLEYPESLQAGKCSGHPSTTVVTSYSLSLSFVSDGILFVRKQT